MSNTSTQDVKPLDDGGDEGPTLFQMQDPYDIERLFRWLVIFDDITDQVETVLPASLLPGPPKRLNPPLSSTSPVPEQFCDTSIILSERSHISESMLKRMNVDQEATEATEWLSEWANSLGSIKTKQHRSTLQENGVALTTRMPARPPTCRTKKAKNFRTLMANKLFASTSIEEFMEQDIDERMQVYRDKFAAPGTITISDPAKLGTDVLTHCIASLPDEHARSFLSNSSLDFLPAKERPVWREANQHFWRNNVFVINAEHIHAVLNTMDARTKRTIGMLHVNLEVPDDEFENSPSHTTLQSETIHGEHIELIRHQTKDLRRLAQECYNLTWLRIHIYSRQLEDKLQRLIKTHRTCLSTPCPHTSAYKTLCLIIQRRIEHLTWLFHSSLHFKPNTIFIDVEHISLNRTTTTFNVHFDHAKLDNIGVAIQAARQKRRREQMEEMGTRIVERRVRVSKGRIGGPVHRGLVEEMGMFVDEEVSKGRVADEGFRARFLEWKGCCGIVGARELRGRVRW